LWLRSSFCGKSEGWQAPAPGLTDPPRSEFISNEPERVSIAFVEPALVAESQEPATFRRATVATLERKDRVMSWLVHRLGRMRLFYGDLELHLIRASMVIIYFFFGYQKWFNYEAQGLIPFFTHGPLIFWIYPLFGVRGSSYLLGVSAWLFGALLLAGFWSRKLGILGALGSIMTFLCTVTIIPFMPDGWAPSAGGFPAMAGNVAFLMKDLALLAVSFYLLKQDVVRASLRI
jgi:uncharacterized membrane protein YkgB